jgi:hypothetical protein
MLIAVPKNRVYQLCRQTKVAFEGQSVAIHALTAVNYEGVVSEAVEVSGSDYRQNRASQCETLPRRIFEKHDLTGNEGTEQYVLPI